MNEIEKEYFQKINIYNLFISFLNSLVIMFFSFKHRDTNISIINNLTYASLSGIIVFLSSFAIIYLTVFSISFILCFFNSVTKNKKQREV